MVLTSSTTLWRHPLLVHASTLTSYDLVRNRIQIHALSYQFKRVASTPVTHEHVHVSLLFGTVSSNYQKVNEVASKK